MTVMKNKQHEYILKAFIESRIPANLRRSAPEIMIIDSIIGGYCMQLVEQSKFIDPPSGIIISKPVKAVFSELIKQNNQTTTSNFPCNFNFTVSNMNRFNQGIDHG